MKTGQVVMIGLGVAILAIAVAYFLHINKKSKGCSSCAKASAKDQSEVDSQISVVDPVNNMEVIVSPIGENPTIGTGQTNMQTRIQEVFNVIDQTYGAPMSIDYTKTDKFGNILETGKLDPSV